MRKILMNEEKETDEIEKDLKTRCQIQRARG
jgi:hypothetical protein